VRVDLVPNALRNKVDAACGRVREFGRKQSTSFGTSSMRAVGGPREFRCKESTSFRTAFGTRSMRAVGGPELVS
jgi:hypothetical protein